MDSWLGLEGLGLCKREIWVENKGDPCLQIQGMIVANVVPRPPRVKGGDSRLGLKTSET